MNLQESGEMYLETILVLSKKKERVRAIDICEYLDYSKPSVSRALGILKEGNYVTVGSNGALSLTESGLRIATKIYERHELLTDMLIRLGVSEETADRDACKIEHRISDESFEAIKAHLKALNNN
ncbi:MAG: metal-dependent transcriptional regulator [Clostridia bacterium]|nr:metal-dependent transcriptional regulator [Clostridia bacterium]